MPAPKKATTPGTAASKPEPRLAAQPEAPPLPEDPAAETEVTSTGNYVLDARRSAEPPTPEA